MVHWYELVVTDARFQQLLEFRDLEMNQLHDGRIQRLLGLQPGAEQLEALAERGSDFERHPEATLQKGCSLAALLHSSGDCKKLTSGWIGIAFLFFVASFLFTNIEHLLDKVLKSGKKRNFWHSRALSIGLIFFTALLFFVPSQVNLLTTLLPERFGVAGEVFAWFRGDVAYFLAHVVIFFLLVRVVPNRDMHSKEIFLGAVLFGALTLVARMLFRWYMVWALERYSYVYGSLTILVILVLWIYYWSVIFVFCAEVVSALEKLFEREAPAE